MNRIVKIVLLFSLLGTIAAACVQPAATPTTDLTDTPGERLKIQPSATPTSTMTPTPIPSLTPSPTPQTAEVTISPSSGPPEEEAQFTRTDIHLIAVGDDGQSGQEIGCDDSVIPVEVEIEPTIAPLTAAMKELLALDSREYGQSGLYNALYRSDLTVESIDIENQEAIIELSGTLRVGGVCDEPRVRAQLRQTALQYETVDRVSIYIDGTPLDELLGQVE